MPILSLLMLFMLSSIQPALAQTGCKIDTVGYPPQDLNSPTCADTEKDGVWGTNVSWTPPTFSLNCGSGGSGYSFNMTFDLPENQIAAGCWEFNRVQRVGNGNGVLQLWQSSAPLGPIPSALTPAFYISGSTNIQLQIYAVEDFNVKVYLVNPTDTSIKEDVTPVGEINVTGNSTLTPYSFSINPSTLINGAYRIRFMFEGGSSNANYLDVLSVNATVAANACTSGVDFTTTANYNPPSFFPVGTTTVSYNITCNSCSPVINQTVSFDVVVNGILASITDNTPTNCGLSNGSITFDTTLANASQVQYSLDGGAWTTIAAPFTISGLSGGDHTLNVRALFGATYCSIPSPINFTTATSADVTKPVITTCAGDQSSSTTAGICTAPVPDFTANVVASDVCSNITITQSPVAGALVGPGVHVVTITVTDEAGNFETCTASFTVSDATIPVITSCASNQSANTTTGICTAPVPDFTANVIATDNCGNGAGNLTITQSPVAGTLVAPGDHTITITVMDLAGNQTTCTATFTVTDNSVPVITSCAGDQSANTTAGTCTAPVPNFTANVVASDNCTGSANLVVTQSPTAGTLVGPGPHTITITVADVAGNETTCTATFTVTDNSVPVITSCAGNQTASTTTGTCTAPVPNFVANVVATDNCAGSANLTITQSPLAGTLVGPGPHTITITVEDEAGNTTTCTATFTVTDNSKPEITGCASPQSVTTGSVNCMVAVPNFTTSVTATDNCTGPANLTITQSPAAGTMVGVGVHPITITVTDQYGNFQTCSTTFTVVDDISPVITSCPAAQEVNAGNNCSAPVPNFATLTVATDVCSAPGALTKTQVPSAGTQLGLGIHTVTITVTDASGNSTTCTTTFTVVDNTPPTINCPTTITTPDDGCGTATILITPPPASDNCSPVIVTGERSDNLPLTSPFPIGTTTITWTATDTSNRASTCVQTIVVTKSTGTIIANYTFLGFTAYPFNANETAPGISSSVNSLEPFAYTGSGTPTGVGAFKNNPGTNEALVLQPSSGENTRYIDYVVSGSTLKYYSQFKVYFQAERQPQGATMVTLAYSLDGTTYTNVGSPLSLTNQTTWYEGIYDLSSIAALNTFNLSTIYFRLYASGSDAKSSSDATRLEVDNFEVFAAGVGPIINCPADQMIELGQTSDCLTTVDPGMATGEGRCGIPTISYLRSDGLMLSDPYPVGITTITWKATDENGAFATCDQTITINGICIVPASGLVLKGSRSGQDVHLNWKTLTEQNTSYFILERSFDGIKFEPVPEGSRVPAAGNSNSLRNYYVTDKDALADMIYYRVKMYDNNGGMKLSNLVAVTMNITKKLRVFPNPVTDYVTIEFGENGTYQIDLISDNGQLITLQKEVNVTSSFRTMTMQRNNLVTGQYQMRIWNKTTGKVNTFRLVYLPKNP